MLTSFSFAFYKCGWFPSRFIFLCSAGVEKKGQCFGMRCRGAESVGREMGRFIKPLTARAQQCFGAPDSLALRQCVSERERDGVLKRWPRAARRVMDAPGGSVALSLRGDKGEGECGAGVCGGGAGVVRGWVQAGGRYRVPASTAESTK